MTFDLGSAARSGSEEPGAQGSALREAQPDTHAPSRGDKPCGFDVARWARERLAAGSSARLGVMGGTFDPVHQGHLHCAERAREACALDAVLFMPAFLPNFKQGRVCAEAVDRMAMCRLAVASNPAFFVSGLEIERGKVTYTADTLRELREVLPAQAEVTFILGADSLATLMRWHDAESLPALASFAAVARPGHEIDPALLARLADAGFDVRVVEASGLDVSSTEVRRRLGRGDSVRYLVPEPARRYIEKRHLYAPAAGGAEGSTGGETPEPFGSPEVPDPQDALSPAFFEARKAELATRVSPKRFQHVMGVVEACERLARSHGVDVPTARLAGLLHDWDKGFDDEGIWQRAASLGLDEALDPWVFANMPQVLHAHTAAVALAREFPQIPREIIQAIDRHTVGDENMTPLEMVLYCADCIEDGRQFGIIPELRELADQVSLEELFFRVYEFWALSLLGRRNMLHPVTMKVWNTLLARRAAEKGK